jgi:homoserine dehydrogenase
MIPTDNILSNVSGTLNAVTFSGHAAGELFLSGHGAGMMPTASAVLADIVDLARNLTCGAAGRVPLTGFQPIHIRPMPIKPMTENVMRYYFRFSALDKPGVLSAIAGILGKHGISIESVHQKGRKTSGTVPVVMMSHRVKENDVRNALKEIRALDTVSGAPVLIRIEDDKPDD